MSRTDRELLHVRIAPSENGPADFTDVSEQVMTVEKSRLIRRRGLIPAKLNKVDVALKQVWIFDINLAYFSI
jgi:hypothetical protein